MYRYGGSAGKNLRYVERRLSNRGVATRNQKW